MRLTPSLVTLAAPLVLAGVASAGVIVVDSTGGGYAQIQYAVNAAVDGDTILVRSGLYQPFTVDDEALTIVAEVGASVFVEGGIRVKDLSAGKVVVLRNLTSVGDQSVPWFEENGLRVTDCDGSVRVEDCTLFGSPGENSVGLAEEPGRPALFASLSKDVSLHHCALIGGPGAFAWLGGAAAAGGCLSASSDMAASFCPGRRAGGWVGT
mgnify:CR=1 FL=1